MKAKFAVLALGVLALMSNGANAQHRTSGQMHVQHLSRIFGHAYGYSSREATRASMFGRASRYAPGEPAPGLIFGPEQPRLDLQ
jgi:hypothetical protein